MRDPVTVELTTLMGYARCLSCGRATARRLRVTWWSNDGKLYQASGQLVGEPVCTDCAMIYEEVAQSRGWSIAFDKGWGTQCRDSA